MRTAQAPTKLDAKTISPQALLVTLLANKAHRTTPTGTIRFIDDPANKDIVAAANKQRSELVNDFIQHAIEISDHSQKERLIQDVLESKNALGQILHAPTSSLKFFIGGFFSQSKDQKKTTNSIADISLFFVQHLHESFIDFIKKETQRLSLLDQKSDLLFINALSQISTLANNLKSHKPSFKKDLANILIYLDTFTLAASKSEINNKNWEAFKTTHALALAHIHLSFADKKVKFTPSHNK